MTANDFYFMILPQLKIISDRKGTVIATLFDYRVTITNKYMKIYSTQKSTHCIAHVSMKSCYNQKRLKAMHWWEYEWVKKISDNHMTKIHLKI